MVYYNIGLQDGLLGKDPEPVGICFLYMLGYNKGQKELIEGVIH